MSVPAATTTTGQARPAHAARKYGGMIRRGVTCLQRPSPAATPARSMHACMHDTQCSAVQCGGWQCQPWIGSRGRLVVACGAVGLPVGIDGVLACLPAWPHTEIDTVAVRPMASFCWSLLFRRDLNSSCLRYPPPLYVVCVCYRRRCFWTRKLKAAAAVDTDASSRERTRARP